jgi:hypothetical protein
MRMKPARERAVAPARRLPVLESLGREEEEVVADADWDPGWREDCGGGEAARKGKCAAALWRIALSEVK